LVRRHNQQKPRRLQSGASFGYSGQEHEISARGGRVGFSVPEQNAVNHPIPVEEHGALSGWI
jgi:hypothetical protein